MNGFQFFLLLALCSFAYSTKTCSDEEQECINDLVDWCKNQDYSDCGYSVWTVTEKINGKTINLKCITDKTGTKCTKDGKPWFVCTADNIAYYKGTKLRKDSPNGADGEICYAASRITTISWTVKDDEQCCINDLVDWCKGQDYSNVCPSVWTFSETIKGNPFKIECKTDEKGTKCTLNGSFLFQCSCDNTATYKDVELCYDSPDGADCDICYAASKITSIILTEEEKPPVKNGKQKCVDDLVDWCKKQNYKNAEYAQQTTTIPTSSGIVTLYCVTSKKGKVCTINGFPWYACYPDHTTTYENKVLQKGSINGIDDQICYAANKAING